jgi:hypothetical protein
MEKEIKSVANVTRIDLSEMLRVVVKYGIKPEVLEFPLEDAIKALLEVKMVIIGVQRYSGFLKVRGDRSSLTVKKTYHQLVYKKNSWDFSLQQINRHLPNRPSA